MRVETIKGIFPINFLGKSLPTPPMRVICGDCKKAYVYQNLSFAAGMRHFWSGLIYRGWEVIGGVDGTLPSYRCPECKGVTDERK